MIATYVKHKYYFNLSFDFYCVTPFPCRAVHQTQTKAEKQK